MNRFSTLVSSLLACSTLLILSDSSLASNFSLSKTFVIPNITDRDVFGTSVALDGNNVLIGAPGNDSDGFGVGRAYLFNVFDGSLSQIFTMPDITGGDFFGASVALDGNNVLIGAPFNSSDGNEVGRAYLFNASDGSLSQTFTIPDVTSFDEFGGAYVALDGNNVLIGAPGNDSDGFNVGRAYLFNVSDGSLSQTFTIPDAIGFNNNFGWSVALDGDNILIGAPGHTSDGIEVGRVYLFNVSDGSLSQIFTMPNATDFDSFGFSVALDGDNVLIGAFDNDSDGFKVGRAYLFNVSDGSLSQTFTMPDVTDSGFIGFPIALDGNNVLLGAPFNDSDGFRVGRVYLFNASNGSLSQTFTMPDVTDSDFFGNSVALDNNNVLIGAPGNDSDGFYVGRAYLFSFESDSKNVPEPSNVLALGSILLGLIIRNLKKSYF